MLLTNIDTQTNKQILYYFFYTTKVANDLKTMPFNKAQHNYKDVPVAILLKFEDVSIGLPLPYMFSAQTR